MAVWAAALVLSGCAANRGKSAAPELKIVKTTLAKDVFTKEGRYIPLDPASEFLTGDAKAVSHVKYADLTGKHNFRWKWVDPSGNIYLDTYDYPVSAPSGKIIRDGSVWHQISIRDEKAMNLPGDWSVQVYQDNQLIATEKFAIHSETPAGIVISKSIQPEKKETLSPKPSKTLVSAENPSDAITPENRKDLNTPSAAPVAMPPMLAIKDIAVSKNKLSAGESANLTVTIENKGMGDAEDVFLVVDSDNSEIQLENRQQLGKIPKNGGVIRANIPITGSADLQSGKAAIDIEVVEPIYHVKIKGKRITIPTREFEHPGLVLARFAALEGDSTQANRQIDINEIVDVKLAVQNIGQGSANDVAVSIQSDQEGVMFLGQGEGTHLVKDANVPVGGLESGKYCLINYRYFVNSDFKGKELQFVIAGTEKSGKYGFSSTKTVPINSELKEEGQIRTVPQKTDVVPDEIVVADLPDFEGDANIEIPKTRTSRPDAVAVVIGNRNYQNKDIPVVKYAHRDAQAMKEYLVNTLGYKPGNILFETDITKARFEALFGIEGNYQAQLHSYIKPGRTEVFIYYSGHGAPDTVSMKGYFVPVDCDPSAIAFNGYPLDVFYRNIAKLGAKQVVVVLEACFSGGTSTGQMMIANASPFALKMNPAKDYTSTTTVLASSRNDQISSWYNEKQHGLFTYFFLKGLSGPADQNHDRKITVEEMYQFVSDRAEGVPYWARRLHGGRVQEPELIGRNTGLVLVNF